MSQYGGKLELLIIAEVNGGSVHFESFEDLPSAKRLTVIYNFENSIKITFKIMFKWKNLHFKGIRQNY